MKMTDEVKAELREMRKNPSTTYQGMADALKVRHNLKISRETIKGFFKEERQTAQPAAMEQPSPAPAPLPLDALDVPPLTAAEIKAVQPPANYPAVSPAPAMPASSPIAYSLSEQAPAAAPKVRGPDDEPTQKELREAADAVGEMIMMSHTVVFEKIGAPLSDTEKEMGRTCWVKVARYYMPKMGEGALALIAVGAFEATIIGTRLDVIMPGKNKPPAQQAAPLQVAAKVGA